MSKEKIFVEKKLRGSGGYAIAKVSDDEQKIANLGGPELFLAGIGKLDNDRFKKYYCNKCEKEYQGAPNLEFENPNEDLGENIILKEKGEYKCKTCDYIIAQYRKFDESKKGETETGEVAEVEAENDKLDVVLETQNRNESKSKSKSSKPINQIENNNDDKAIPDAKSTYLHIEKIIGMSTYDNNAHLIGKVQEIGLRKLLDGNVEFSFKIKNSNNEIKEIEWNKISKIGDIIILADQNSQSNEIKSRGSGSIHNINGGYGNSYSNTDINSSSSSSSSSPPATTTTTRLDGKMCKNCRYNNEVESIFCEECGKKLE
jgi:sporulation protein YlmC with PRC-barrel domain